MKPEIEIVFEHTGGVGMVQMDLSAARKLAIHLRKEMAKHGEGIFWECTDKPELKGLSFEEGAAILKTPEKSKLKIALGGFQKNLIIDGACPFIELPLLDLAERKGWLITEVKE